MVLPQLLKDITELSNREIVLRLLFVREGGRGGDWGVGPTRALDHRPRGTCGDGRLPVATRTYGGGEAAGRGPTVTDRPARAPLAKRRQRQTPEIPSDSCVRVVWRRRG